jgi:hypothetical protein
MNNLTMGFGVRFFNEIATVGGALIRSRLNGLIGLRTRGAGYRSTIRPSIPVRTVPIALR